MPQSNMHLELVWTVWQFDYDQPRHEDGKNGLWTTTAGEIYRDWLNRVGFGSRVSIKIIIIFIVPSLRDKRGPISIE